MDKLMSQPKRLFTIQFDHEQFGKDKFFDKSPCMKTTDVREEAYLFDWLTLKNELSRISLYSTHQSVPLYTNIRIRAYHGSRN